MSLVKVSLATRRGLLLDGWGRSASARRSARKRITHSGHRCCLVATVRLQLPEVRRIALTSQRRSHLTARVERVADCKATRHQDPASIRRKGAEACHPAAG